MTRGKLLERFNLQILECADLDTPTINNLIKVTDICFKTLQGLGDNSLVAINTRQRIEDNLERLDHVMMGYTENTQGK